MRGERGQISVEYLLIIGLTFGLLVPGVIFFYQYSQSNIDKVTNEKLNQIGLDMVSTAKSAYALGKNSWQTLDVAFPEQVKEVRVVNGNEIVMVYNTAFGETEAVFFSDITLTPGYPEDPQAQNGKVLFEVPRGPTKIRFTSLGSTILVNETIE